MSDSEAMPVTVYTPDSSLASPASMLRDMLRDLIASRELAWRLAVRDISAQYRQAALGLLWAFILPIANTLTWIFLNGTGVVAVGDTALPYAVYVFTGTMLWAIFMHRAVPTLRRSGKPPFARPENRPRSRSQRLAGAFGLDPPAARESCRPDSPRFPARLGAPERRPGRALRGRANSCPVSTSCNAAQRPAGRALAAVAAFTRWVTCEGCMHSRQHRHLRTALSGQLLHLGVGL